VGAHVWVLHPSNGVKVVAEGIAGSRPATRQPEDASCTSLLAELRDEGKQMVQVTWMHKKNTELMYPELDEIGLFLDDFVTPPAPSNTYVPWCTQFLRAKQEEV
jgi:hypothetical protein